MIDDLLARIEATEAKGWVVLLKWDGGRTVNRRTVVVSWADETPGTTDHPTIRRDGDNVAALLEECLDWADNHVFCKDS